MPDRASYDIVPRPKPFKPTGEPVWPVDAILATADSGDAVRIPHDKQESGFSVGRKNRKNRTGVRARLLTLIRHGLKRRGYGMEWAPDGDSAIIVWAIRLEGGSDSKT